MRWLFLLLLVLNGFYLVWNLQDAPIRAKDIGGVQSGQRGSGGIQLLSEASESRAPQAGAGSSCLFVGGYREQRDVATLGKRLHDAGLSYQSYFMDGETGREHWLRLPSGQNTGDDAKVAEVLRNISGLSQKIIPCEGIATPE